MIVLDTNVVSEPLKAAPAQAVLDWLDAQAPETLYLSTVGLAELLAGVHALPAGKRRTALQKAVSEQVLPLFSGRVLSFDERAAEAFAAVHAAARKAGNPISFADCAIAAIAAAKGFLLATRNGSDFKGTGVGLVDPWAR
ncbi:MAG: type II toxin-antitoxin system VapC family toxin [Myxococcales bacterium]|nr:type II toxin-antitoxin system VapC family toxin [Myxococcales bacterium]